MDWSAASDSNSEATFCASFEATYDISYSLDDTSVSMLTHTRIFSTDLSSASIIEPISNIIFSRRPLAIFTVVLFKLQSEPS